MPKRFPAKISGALCFAVLSALWLPTAAPAADGSQVDTRDLPFSFGQPVPLTYGEQQKLMFLVPGLDPATIPEMLNSRLRAILYGDRSDTDKRGRIKWLLDL
ncbi:hypothetical protein M4578_05215 [Salipiger sp. P9]|uniref:hypothetical protein n=1 Tax=Salipiger pentaromativorans TaxID=2943193 RepID=UPI0021581DFD|nr:hypothetical protein [Salipiger pentaromativorans]MCR8547216.1 hypothetical protein [Salipiger pentaromativorans]